MLVKYGYIGERIRKERNKYDLSLSELAKEIGVSVSLLSLVENGKATPSMTVLDKLCSFFSIHMASLFEQEEGNPKATLMKSDKQLEIRIDSARTRKFLLPRSGVSIEPVLVVIEADPPFIDFTVHKGVEYGYVLQGSITVEIEGEEPITCSEGDSIFYKASQPHRLLNLSHQRAVGLWMGVPDVSDTAGHTAFSEEGKKARR